MIPAKKFLNRAVGAFTSVILSVSIVLGAAVFDRSGYDADAAFYSRVSVHDPSIVKLEDGSYYMIGSHLGAGHSKDLMNWTDTANASKGTKNTTYFKNIYTDLAVPEKWSNTSSGYDLSGNLWAPDVIWNPVLNKWCMYLSVNGESWHSSIVLCTADDIDGPYTYVDTIVYSGFETNPANAANSYKNTDVEKVLGKDPDLSRYLDKNGRWNAEYGTNAIDPAVLYDEAGNLWMVYGSWFGGIYMLELDEETGLRDYNVKYPTEKDSSDAYMGKKLAGGYWASGEGPYIEYMTPPGSSRGYYYLFLSYGYFHPNGGYNMRIFRSENPNGPYYDQNGNSPIFKRGTDNIGGNVGERLMSNYKWSCNGVSFQAQGHNSALMDDDGKLFVIYHNKFGGMGLFHEIRVHQMIMNEDGWITATPYEYSGETLSENGHTMEAMTGEYEFIVNTLNQNYYSDFDENQTVDIATPVSITLNADGTVSGAVSGKWSVKDNSPYMSITYGGVTYKGAFIVQADESDDMVKKMTFTATGNNTCVWGSKVAPYDMHKDMKDISSDSRLVYKSNGETNDSSAVKISKTELLSGVSYFITNRFNGKSLDLTGGNTEDGTAIQQWNLTGGSHQEWRITETENGYCKIASMKDENMVLTVNGTSADDGLDIVIRKYTGEDNQQWKLVQRRGSYGIVSKCSDDKSGIDVYGWSEENGGEIKQWNYWGGDCQLWNISPVNPTVNDGEYTIKNVNSGLWVGSKDGSACQIDSAEGWNIKQSEDGYYFILDGENALTVKDGSKADRADIYLDKYTGDNAQKFSLYANEDGSYAILSASSDKLSGLDVYGISLESGANICQWDYWGGNGQKFILEPTGASENEKIKGDVNADGKFDEYDLEMMQNWLLDLPDASLTDYEAGELCGDEKIDVFDLIIMKRMLMGTE